MKHIFKEPPTLLPEVFLLGDQRGCLHLSDIDAPEQDQYGRTVAELYVQPRSGLGYQAGEEIAVNAQMVAAGYAYHYAQYSGDCPNGGLLSVIESQAQAARRGVWSNPRSERPWDYRRSR